MEHCFIPSIQRKRRVRGNDFFFSPLCDLKALQKYNMSVLQEKKRGVGWMTQLIVLYGVSLEDK